MRLSDRLSRRVGDRTYRKWHLGLSNDDEGRPWWSRGQNTMTGVGGGRLVIEPADEGGE